jgi:hypothetical protein
MRYSYESRFLLVKLQVQYVLGPKDAGEKRRRLNSLPKSPTEAYRGVFERMTSDDLRFARRILGWVLHAVGILTMPELQEALAIEIGVVSFNPEDVTSPEDIISTCGGLVDQNEYSGLVTFSHETVRPFLEEHEMTLSHSDLCRTCLTYLQLPMFGVWGDSQYYNKFTRFKFRWYAAGYWATHAVQSRRDVQLETAILETLQDRRDAIATLRHEDHKVGRTVLHTLIENGLSFIFTMPLSGNETFQERYAPLLKLD